MLQTGCFGRFIRCLSGAVLVSTLSVLWYLNIACVTSMLLRGQREGFRRACITIGYGILSEK